MAKVKVCLVTGAGGQVGQHVVAKLVERSKKVIALAEADEVFSPDILKTHKIKINTALPVTKDSFSKYDVQFCFGDLSDISFIASIFASADKSDIEIEYVFHLTANSVIQKSSPLAYHPDLGDIVNVLEVARAYWQDHKDVFKNFFYPTDDSKQSSKIENMIKKISEKYNFPVTIFKENTPIGAKYNGKTSISSLYRLVTPVKSNILNKYNNMTSPQMFDEKIFLRKLTRALEDLLKD